MAATQNTEGTQFLAGEDMSDWQYKQVLISITEDKTLIKADGAANADRYKMAFTLLNKPRKGEGALAAFSGRTLASAGAAFARDAELVIDGTGRLITIPDATNANVVARALEAATAAGQDVDILVERYYKRAA